MLEKVSALWQSRNGVAEQLFNKQQYTKANETDYLSTSNAY